MNDKDFMRRCFDLAQKGKGFVSPNPLVGCVIVKDGKIISEGWHAKFGEAHAEVMAISKTREDLKKATLYCNLEPCCHSTKKTPPCLPLVINSGIKKVVLCTSDPNPEVAGKSIEHMLKAGIEVQDGLLKEEGLELNRFFFKHIKTGNPWITVKIAQSLDCKISASHSEQTWLTGKESGTFVHGLRSEYDAVLVGAQTIITDNPKLTVRKIEGRDPVKVVIDGKLSISENASIFNNKPGRTYIFCEEKETSSEKAKALKNHSTLIGCPLNFNGLIDLGFIFNFLGGEGIMSILVEGGQSIFSQTIESNLFDEVIILQTPNILGPGIEGLKIKEQVRLNLKYTMQLDKDCCINLRKESLSFKIL